MGIQVECFTSCSAACDFECAICLMIASPPCVFPCSNEHVFCEHCATALKECPFDREAKADKSIAKLSGQSRRIYNKLELKCPKGCEWQGILSDLEHHLQTKCPEESVACTFPGCEVKLLRKDLVGHLEACPQREVRCELCPESMREWQLESHKATCPGVLVECPSGADRCEKLPRSTVEAHLQTCPFSSVPCEWAEFGCRHTCERQSMPTHHSNSEAILAHLEAVRSTMRVQRSEMAEVFLRLNNLTNKVESLSSPKPPVSSPATPLTPASTFTFSLPSSSPSTTSTSPINIKATIISPKSPVKSQQLSSFQFKAPPSLGLTPTVPVTSSQFLFPNTTSMTNTATTTTTTTTTASPSSSTVEQALDRLISGAKVIRRK